MTIDDYSQLSPDLVIRAVESTGRISDARVMALNSLGLTQRLTNNSCLCNDKSLFFMFNNVIPR